ncbi:DUF2441 domain-containing protein [Shewanella frigidimarina]|uniref:DUF2441 domain-containing protein n=1 Tax=Shewanella frigidimarina TaxID=56812 RepID=UPI001404F340|nr:DUF2441 domain-containing protein [Shewanella frigidimarina]
MATYFTVDRSGTLLPESIINLRIDYSKIHIYAIENLITTEELINRTHQLYPDGLSNFGVQYLHEHNLIVKDTQTRQSLNFAPHIPVLEGIFEQVRLNEFPERPSRMQSMFGWCTKPDAVVFKEAHGNVHNIFEVHSGNAFIADQNLLYLGASIMGTYEFARKYWSGDRSNNYKPEAVIPLPSDIGVVVI